jgi:hypothetical protein
MEIRNVPSSDIVGTAILRTSEKWGNNITTKEGIIVTGVRANGQMNVRTSLRAHSSLDEGVRESASGRKGPWVCWHAHRDFFRALFELAPDATVRTGLGRAGVTYSAGTFENDFPGTYNMNAGSEWYPREFGSLCGHGGKEA